MRYLLLLLLPLLFQANDLPSCFQRPGYVGNPWVDGTRYCLEDVLIDDSGGELSYSALAFAPDGTLYATRPLHGEVYALTDSDGDALPDTPRRVADGLTLPNGLTFHDGALYISGGPFIHRLRDDELTVLVNDLPGVGGFWTGDVVIGQDERLYVATGAACVNCASSTPERGAILSYALDGSDRQIVATGLRQPVGLAFRDGQLWTVDTAPDALGDTPDLDELNRVTPGVDFGWPGCVTGECDGVQAPALTFPTHSHPRGMAAYAGDTLVDLDGALIVVLGGSFNRVDLRGYAVMAVAFDDNGNPTSYRALIPQYTEGGAAYSTPMLNLRTSGFWPRRPLDVAVSPQGWLFVSVEGGRIVTLRPLD